MKSLRVAFCPIMALAIVSCSAGGHNGVVPSTLQSGGARTPISQTNRHIALPAAGAPKFRRHDSSGALADGGFESGGYTYWQQCGNVNASVQTTYVHSGVYAEGAGTGSAAEINGNSGLCQQVTVPANGTITFWVKQDTNDTVAYADQEADLLDSTGAVIYNLYTTASNTNGWVQKSYSLASYAGQTVWLYFGVYAGGYSGYWIYQDVDDVAWDAAPTPVPTATPTPSGGPTPIATPANGGGNSTGTCGTSCGVQRWHIKTLGDAYVNTINWTPAHYTVADMAAWPVPAGYDQYNDTTRYAPYETQSVTVRATLVGWKTESDNDYHIVIADLNNPSSTLIIEPPDPTCSSACDGGFAKYFSAVRTKLTNCFGAVPGSFTNFPSGIVVDVTGVPLFDALHGQTGVAPNGIEIHPLLNIDFVSGTTCT